MNKAYSNKALPPGTVVREWRLEDVLGVGGFGIVYKGRGIYFNELVAIKEYFPSSISDRDSDDTVVPIDSDAEEVHALGLKKFVEEAKLLWNLSTPSRHPNIVSVRSLFEIHGTAYMVMDFEDGLSLSKMLKQGRRFNERSLWNILRPIAEGLDRAHRVGVLHRDIKPPNILINEDNRPVLIDFGSARFEAAEATSTKVTFHTPPYAAIEQYVKTYEQGPWTDIYALGVVMYECVTGEKPPEVLERLHAGLGKPLSGGKWPGYSKRFLAAIDAAMTVKPDERPQSIADWLPMFGKQAGEAAEAAEGNEEATRFYAQQVHSDEIVPVAAAAEFDRKARVETGVPDDPKKAEFKRAGEETGASRKKSSAAGKKGGKRRSSTAAAQAAAVAAAAAEKERSGAGLPDFRELLAKAPRNAVIAGSAIALVVAAGAGAMIIRGGDSVPAAVSSQADAALPAASVVDAALGGGAAATNAVGNDADGVAALEPGEQADEQSKMAEDLRREAAKTAAAEARLAEMRRAAARAEKAQARQGASNAQAQGARPTAGQATTAGSARAGVSPAKVAQFHAIVDEARSMAKRVMRSGSRENARLAKEYDQNLKTLKDSMRGIQSDSEADRLISQARLTRSYVQFLLRQQ